MSNIYSVHLSVFERLAPLVCKEVTRCYIGGVCLDNGKAVATNGHALGIVDIRQDAVFPDHKVIIKHQNIIKAGKLLGRGEFNKKKYVVLDEDKKSASIIMAEDAQSAIGCYTSNHKIAITIGDIIIDGTYPDYMRVVPKFSGEKVRYTQIQIDLKKLEHFKDAGMLKYSCGLSFLLPETENGPLGVLIDNTPDFVGVVMPMRCDSDLRGFAKEVFQNEKTQKTDDGKLYQFIEDDEDLVSPAPKKINVSAWANVCPSGVSILYESKDHADACASDSRIACKRIEFEVEEGEGL